MECSGTEGTVSLDWGRWTMRAFPGQDLLTARLQKFGRREHLTVNWQDLGG